MASTWESIITSCPLTTNVYLSALTDLTFTAITEFARQHFYDLKKLKIVVFNLIWHYKPLFSFKIQVTITAEDEETS